MMSFIRKSKYVALIGRLAILGMILGIASNGWAQGEPWVQKNNLSEARWTHSASVVEGKIYIIGGATSEPNSEFILPVEVYDPVTDSCMQKANIPTGRVALSTSVVNGKIYAIGGAIGNMIGPSGCSTVEEYDPISDTWTTKALMPTPRAALSTSVVDGKIYAIGGTLILYNLVGLSTVEMYDPATDTWTTKANMPTPRLGLCTAVVDGQIYAIGGSILSPAGPIVEAYNPETDTWTTKTDMPTARRNFATSVLDGNIYAIGGWVRSSYYAFRTVEQYDPITDTWVTKTDLPVARSCLSASTVNRKIYAIGGTDKTHPCPALSTVYEYDAAADTTSATSVGWVNIYGTITYEGNQLCSMVLANGQHMFTCGQNEGFYDLTVPLDENGEITLYGFCSGFSPFKTVLTPEEALDYEIQMIRAAAGSKEIEVTVQTEAGITNPDFIRVNGTVTYNGQDLCTMVLANGQNMFTCGADLGAFDLEVPLDGNGEITLYCFCSGFAPFKDVFMP